MAVKECKSANECYFVTKGPWYEWGRWVFLGCLILVVLLAFPFAGWLMSLKRVRDGQQPIVGCGWMFKNPYKHATKDLERGNVIVEQQQRYRPHHMLDLYRRENESENQTSDYDSTRNTHNSEDNPFHASEKY